MNLSKTIRNEARLDSRRFAKSTICRIVYDGLLPNILSLAKQLNVLNNDIAVIDSTGYCPLTKSIVVVPVTKVKYLTEKYNEYLSGISEIAKIGDSNKTTVEHLEAYTALVSDIKTTLMQTLQMVSLENVQMPGGIEAGLDPKLYDIAIEQDSRQSTIGRYVRRNKT